MAFNILKWLMRRFESPDEFKSSISETTVSPAIELFTLISVNIFHTFFLDLLTGIDWGTAYLMFLWCVFFNSAAICALILVFFIPSVSFLPPFSPVELSLIPFTGGNSFSRI